MLIMNNIDLYNVLVEYILPTKKISKTLSEQIAIG